MNLDAVRIIVPPSLAIESVPDKTDIKLRKSASYTLLAEKTPNSVTMRRTLLMGDVLFPSDEYADVRAFYSGMETKDQDSIVLTQAASKAANTGN